MAKAELKTKATEVSIADFIAALPDVRRCEEAALLDTLHRRVTGLKPKMWGPSIIGYGSYDYTYASGHSGTSCRAGFSPRKAALVFYLMGGEDAKAELLYAQLGKHSRGRHVFGIQSSRYPTITFDGRGRWKMVNESLPGDALVIGDESDIAHPQGGAQGKISGNQLTFPHDPRGGLVGQAFAGTWGKE